MKKLIEILENRSKIRKNTRAGLQPIYDEMPQSISKVNLFIFLLKNKFYGFFL